MNEDDSHFELCSPINHEVIGICVQCAQEAYTRDTDGDPICWGCAQHSAN